MQLKLKINKTWDLESLWFQNLLVNRFCLFICRCLFTAIKSFYCFEWLVSLQDSLQTHFYPCQFPSPRLVCIYDFVWHQKSRNKTRVSLLRLEPVKFQYILHCHQIKFFYFSAIEYMMNSLKDFFTLLAEVLSNSHLKGI